MTMLSIARKLSLGIALLLAAWSALVLITLQPSLWFSLASSGWVLLMLASAAWLQTGSFRALAALTLCAATAGRLFSTLHTQPFEATGASANDLLLQVETGPGVPGYGYAALALCTLLVAQFVIIARQRILASDSQRPEINRWMLVFLRLYVGLMFVPHFAGHLFAGPSAFAIYAQYFSSLGLPFPALMLVLAGTAEVVIAAGLMLGIGTRLVALAGAVYLLMTMWVGRHFEIGYVWILPDGGYEFGVLWAMLCAVFVVVGADTPCRRGCESGGAGMARLTGYRNVA